MKIAIIGLGTVGGMFLDTMLRQQDRGFDIICVAELHETPGRALAQAKGIPVRTLQEILQMGERVDIIFDLTGKSHVRQMVRDTLLAKKNTHTILAPENVARLIWGLITRKELPDPHDQKGYE